VAGPGKNSGEQKKDARCALRSLTARGPASIGCVADNIRRNEKSALRRPQLAKNYTLAQLKV